MSCKTSEGKLQTLAHSVFVLGNSHEFKRRDGKTAKAPEVFRSADISWFVMASVHAVHMCATCAVFLNMMQEYKM